MKGFKKCNNGHFYKEDLPSCPYCPSASGGVTQSSQPTQGSGLDKTQIVGGGAGNSGGSDQTQVIGGSGAGDATTPFGGNQGQRRLDRTYISGMPDINPSDPNYDEKKAEPRLARKLVGWLISYTIDEMGVDYKLYEGRNTIGKSNSNTIRVIADPTISSEHATILYRNGKFKMEDAMSANGTFLNGEEIEVRQAYDIFDGDEIRIASTVFIFKTPIKSK